MMDRSQAEYLADTYADLILRLSYTYLKNTHDAQDICQTVFVRLLTHPVQFDSSVHEKAYIIRMTINACKDILKSPWRKKTCGLDVVADIPAPEQTEHSLLSFVQNFAIEQSSICIIMKNTPRRKSDNCSVFLPLRFTHDYLADVRY